MNDCNYKNIPLDANLIHEQLCSSEKNIFLCSFFLSGQCVHVVLSERAKETRTVNTDLTCFRPCHPQVIF